MSTYRTLNQTVLAKVETTQGEDAAPTTTDDAVLVENPSRNPNLGIVETNEVTGALDDRGPLPAGGFSPFTCDVWLKGSGTGGVPPEFAPFLLGCAMAETILTPALTGTATAGASNTITVVSATGVAVGMIIRTTGGTGPGQTRVITAINSLILTVFPAWTVTPDATTTYSIDAQVLYAPTSTNLDTVTIYRYRHRSDGGDSKLDTVLGAAGSWTLNIPVRNPGRLSFNYQGQLSAPTDVTPPSAAVYDSVRPFPYLNALTYLGSSAIKLNTLSLDFGGQVQLIDNPAQAFGYDAAGVTRRRISGRFNPPTELQSVRDAFSGWLNQTSQQFWVAYGSTAGNRVSIYLPEVRYSGVEEEDVNGFAHEGLPFRALGQNTGLYLSLY